MYEQPGQPSVSSGPNMKWNTSSCERPSKSSARVFVPSPVSKLYSLSTRTHGSSRRCLVSSSLRRVSSFSRSSSATRAASHSSRVPTVCSVIAFASYVPTVDLVVAAYRDLLVAVLWRPLEQLRVAHHEVGLGRVRRVGVVDDPVLEREGAQARPLRRHVPREVGSAGGRGLGHGVALRELLDHLFQ